MKLLKEVKKKILEYKYLWLMIITILLLTFIRLPYYIKIPGGILNIADKLDTNIKINTSGSLNMAYVSEIKATIPTYLYSKINKNWDLEKISEVVNCNETISEQEYRNKMLLNEANSIATIVAFKKANKEISIKSQKNYITFIDEQSKTDLKIKDEIIKINDQKVNNITDIRDILSELNINDTINIETNNGIKKATIYEKENKKIIGIMIASEYELDTDIKFNFNNSESGPSGGLMMTLGIYNYLTNDSLTKGRTIVGTGTIDLNGEVGEIDGVKYKLIGAINNDADIFLVPYENYSEALKTKKDNNYDITIHPINNIEEAIEYLKKE